jgi:general secretion pathway protein G
VPKDPWGTEYQYRNPATKSKQGFDVFSAGRDYKAGTDDDIGNWD